MGAKQMKKTKSGEKHRLRFIVAIQVVLILLLCTVMLGIAGAFERAEEPGNHAGQESAVSSVRRQDAEKTFAGQNSQKEDTKKPPAESRAESSKLLKVPYINQQDSLPTGCEMASGAMLLEFYGYDISAEELSDNYLDKGELTVRGGVLYGPSPYDVFIGDPRSENSYGCYAPVVVKTLNRVLDGSMVAKETTGMQLTELAQTFLDTGNPVLIWASMDMAPTTAGTKWVIEETGEPFQWIKGEHCLVLVGYDEESYYFNDPYKNHGLISYGKKLVEERFKELGRQSVVIENNNDEGELNHDRID